MKEIRDTDLIEEHWNELRPVIRQRWPDLSANELDLINGQPDMLIGMLQQHYSVTREEAALQVREFALEHQSRFAGGGSGAPV